jgi:hypothetical protein
MDDLQLGRFTGSSHWQAARQYFGSSGDIGYASKIIASLSATAAGLGQLGDQPGEELILNSTCMVNAPD